MTLLHRLCPPGFRAMAALAYALLVLGAAQFASLAARDEPYPLAAACLALLLLGGGATLIAFVRWNTRDHAGALPQPPAGSDLLDLAALAPLAALVIVLFWSEGTFFPLRMGLFWRGPLPAERLLEPPLTMMVAGTCLVALGALATAALTGALWLLLYARRLERLARAARAVVAFAGAVPYVAVALLVRTLLCQDVALLAAGRHLALRPDEELAYRSLLAIAPGTLFASLALGLALGRGLWSWLDQVRAAEESSDSFPTALLRGQQPWEVLVRQGLWLRRRRDLAALLLGGLASAALLDILSGTLIDSFRPPGFPPYPSLGAALFLRGIAEGGAPVPLSPSWQLAHVALASAALLLLLAQTLPRRSGQVQLLQGALRVGKKLLVTELASAHGLPPRPALQWVLGASGSGKSSLLRAWAAQLTNAVVVPQDSDLALPGVLTGTGVARLAAGAAERGDLVLWDLLGRLDDQRIRGRLHDPFTQLAIFSRGERQRLMVCLALLKTRADPDCTLLLDEPTSGQDFARTGALIDCLRELLSPQVAGTGSLVIATHDPEPLEALLGDRGLELVSDQVLWIEEQRAHRFTVRKPRAWEGAVQPPGLVQYLAASRTLLDAATSADDGAASSAPPGVRLLGPEVTIAGRRCAISPDARLRGGELAVLYGPSGSGKTTLLREMAFRPAADLELGYVTQDPARAFPAEMPVREVLGARPGEPIAWELFGHWFGPGLSEEVLARPIGALSEGERARVLLAGEVLRLEERPASRALPRVLLLDEPFGAVDPPAHVRLMEALLGWLQSSQGRSAAVLVSHSPQMDLGLARAFGVPAIEWTMAES